MSGNTADDDPRATTRSANRRLALVLGLLALAFYLAMIFIGAR